MHLSKFSDYALRLLLLAASRPGQMITIREAADTYAISQAHLKKVVMLLSRRGYLVAARGHGGGFTLGRAPEAINLGAVVRETEPNFALFACYADPGACVIAPHCNLPGAFDRALAAFLSELDRYTLRDFLLAPGAFAPPRTATRTAART